MRGKVKIRKKIYSDPKYDSPTVAKFINHLMYDGKKSVARKVMYDTFDEVAKSQKNEDPVAIFHTALSNIQPNVEVKSRRVGGANYQVPVEVRGERKMTLAMRWIIHAARVKKGKSMSKKLAEELILANKKEGAAMKKRSDTHRMAEANKAFAHFAW